MKKKNTRTFLTQHEIEQLVIQANKGQNQERNLCMLLLCYFHGLRVSELRGMKLSDFDMKGKILYVRRLKNGLSSSHPLCPRVFRALQTWLTVREKQARFRTSIYLFPSIRGIMLSRQTIYLMIQRFGQMANLDINVHPHMLRHACGYELANKGMDTRLIQDYLGHRNISHTVRYTASNPERFRNIRW
ncbi:tyrosine-type recombinase/integrase [Enterobacteriaceae bacterium H20N1]|uniref:Tyrosine-type recombinase/integrase n=1 Tax=Dryocola boscaweniae TaxID=2925397 RepID=A0A9X2W5U3_9ENTR|nr:tyrosine-type recombinase/integrase [Dryocola boscaweniae]MCT4700543.1 tyrosine-type recombinase/integrase [Dryocola boscaweniae]MCT4717699.1 tyrosine-type recombinase/integrase [Dryocola boscaweniae]